MTLCFYPFKIEGVNFVQQLKMCASFNYVADIQFCTFVQNSVQNGTNWIDCVQKWFLCKLVQLVRFCTKRVHCLNY